MAKKKLRVVQIGTAHDHAADHVDTMHALPEDYELVGVCEPDSARREAAMQRRSYDGLRMSYADVRWLTIEEILAMDDLDAVIIESEEMELVGYAQLFADKGLPIHMDKPCGVDYPAFQKLVETMRAKNLPLHIGYMYRYNAAVKHCLELKESGQLGDIFSVEAHMSVLHNTQKRAWLKKFTGGMMFFLGCHLVDLIYTIQGEPKQVIPLSQDTHLDNVDSYDFGMAALIYDTGVSFAQAADVEPGGFSRRQLVVVGTKATVEIHPLEEYVEGGRLISRVKISGASLNWGLPSEKYEAEPQDRYINMMLSFAEMVRGEKKNPYTPDYEHALYRLILRCCGVEL